MPSRSQRVEISRANYAGSQLAIRNAALKRAKVVSPVSIHCKNGILSRLIATGRVSTVRDYCAVGCVAGEQIDRGREGHLLVEDLLNPGEYRAEPIYDSRVNWKEEKTGKCWLDIHAGELLVDGDTAVYWK